MKAAILMGGGLCWLAALAVGTAMMQRYQTTPGSSGTAPQVWPEESQLHREPGRATVVMAAHPKCPCLRASLEELALLLAENPARAKAFVLFFKPVDAGADWSQTASWRTAAAIPGVTVLDDAAGNEARQFGCETAGDTVFYDGEGRLRFHGGITAGRGESGGNAGQRALQALLGGKPAPQVGTPVFGCSLFTAPSNRNAMHLVGQCTKSVFQ